jgi:Ca2+-binding EF-hand superfamily protein
MNKIPLDNLDQLVDAVFAKYDTNQNGYLEFQEMKKML